MLRLAVTITPLAPLERSRQDVSIASLLKIDLIVHVSKTNWIRLKFSV